VKFKIELPQLAGRGDWCLKFKYYIAEKLILTTKPALIIQMDVGGAIGYFNILG